MQSLARNTSSYATYLGDNREIGFVDRLETLFAWEKLAGTLLKALQVLIFAGLVIVAFLWVSSGRIDAVLPYSGGHLVTVATYLLLFLYVSRYFEGRTSAVSALGFSILTLIAAVEFYEFLFKASFPLADPYNTGRLKWLLTNDLVPAAKHFLTASVFLVTYRWWNTKSRMFLAALTIFVTLWTAWIILAYPLDVEAYELDWKAFPLTMAFNMTTKVSAASLFAAILSTESPSRATPTVCRQCGAGLDETSNFCRECGTPVTVESPDKARSRNILLAVLVVGMVLSYSVFFVNAPHPAEPVIVDYQYGTTCEQWSWIGGYHCSERYWWGDVQIRNEGERGSTFEFSWTLLKGTEIVEEVCVETPPIEPNETRVMKHAFGPYVDGDVETVEVHLGC